MDQELLKAIEKELPLDFKSLPWPTQRNILKRLKTKLLKERDQCLKPPPPMRKPPHAEPLPSLPAVNFNTDVATARERIEEANKRDSTVRIITNGIDGDKPFVVVSFFTVGTGYEKEVKNLILSLERFDIPYYMEGIKSLGNWIMNTQYKPVLIRRALDVVKRPVVCIDADAVVKQYPSLFGELENVDFAAYFAHSYREKDKELFPNIHFLMDRLLSGTIYFNNTDGAFRLLDQWRQRCLDDKTTIDQNLLLDCVKAMRDEIKIYPLPLAYCQIYDIMREHGEPVIEHYQASRRNRTTPRSKTNMGTKIAILTPSKWRPDGIRRLVTSAHESATYPDRLSFHFLIPGDDGESFEAVRELKKTIPDIHCYREPERGPDEDINYSSMWNVLYKKARRKGSEIFGFFGDDVEFRTWSWDAMVAEEFRKRHGLPWMIRTNETGDNYRKSATLFFTNRLLHDVIGYYLNEDYVQTYMDTFWDDVTNGAGCFTFLRHIITYHHSIVLKRAPVDENYREKMKTRHRIIDADHELYHSDGAKRYREDCSRRLVEYMEFVKNKKE